MSFVTDPHFQGFRCGEPFSFQCRAARIELGLLQQQCLESLLFGFLIKRRLGELLVKRILPRMKLGEARFGGGDLAAQGLQLPALFGLLAFLRLARGCRPGTLPVGSGPAAAALLGKPGGILVEAAGKVLDPALVHQHQAITADAQQIPVVRHQYHGAGEILQRDGERLAHLQVEVIGRLVEQQ